jgi:organic radical activating enzyme
VEPRFEAFVDEVFLSVQGEGIWVGARQVFVRFSGCGLDCAYCDSQRARRLASAACVHDPAIGAIHEEANPVRAEALTAIVRSMAAPREVHSVAITGGEPLLQHRFLAAWLPSIKSVGYRVYLETAGNLAERLKCVLPHVDFCSMDVKLPSATGMRSFVPEHKAFLAACRVRGVPTMAKAVVSGVTTTEEIEVCARMIAETMPEATLVIQPVTPTERQPATPSPSLLLVLQSVALRYLDSVRVIPQTHRLVGIP